MSQKSALKNWKVWLGIAVSVVAMLLFLKDFREPEKREALLHAFREANYLWLVPAILVMYSSVYIRGMRWQLFFRKIGHVSYNRLFGIEMVGFMGNSIFPLRAGELMRAYLLGRKEKIGLSSSIATIAMERFFDLVMVVICFAAVSGVFNNVSEMINARVAEMAQSGLEPGKALLGLQVVFSWLPGFSRKLWIVIVAIVGGGLFALYAPRVCEKVVSIVLKAVPHHLRDGILHVYRQFVLGLECLRDPQAIIMGSIYTALIWLTICYSEYLVIKAFDLDTMGIGPMEILFIMTLLAGAVAMPQGPGYIGVFQLVVAGTVGLLTHGQATPEMIERSEQTAPAFAIMLWFVQMIPIVLAGFVSLSFMGLSLTELRHDAEETEEEMEEKTRHAT
jgi:hypothetical protein